MVKKFTINKWSGFLKSISSEYAVARLSVIDRLYLSPTQVGVIFRNISMAFGTLAIHGHPPKILRRSSQGNPSAGGVEHKRGSKI